MIIQSHLTSVFEFNQSAVRIPTRMQSSLLVLPRYMVGPLNWYLHVTGEHHMKRHENMLRQLHNQHMNDW